MQAQSIEICYEKNIGGSQRLKIAYRENLIVPLRSFYQNTTFSFLFAKTYALDLPVFAHAIDYNLTLNTQNLKVIIDTPTNIQAWQNWFRDNLASRVVSAEIIDQDGNIETLHNLQVLDFNKTNTANRTNPKTIELNFVPAKIRPQSSEVQFKKIIQSIDAFPSAQSPYGIINTDVIINLFSFCDPDIFSFGYSTTPNISDVVYNNFIPIAIIRSLPNGVYYFFAVNTQSKKYYDYMKGTLLNGNITFDNTPVSDSLNNPFISDSITPDTEVFGELSQQ